jgi:hypothetical protein
MLEINDPVYKAIYIQISYNFRLLLSETGWKVWLDNNLCFFVSWNYLAFKIQFYTLSHELFLIYLTLQNDVGWIVEHG